MKRLGKINRKPVVEGNPNKLKPTDITLKEACGCEVNNTPKCYKLVIPQDFSTKNSNFTAIVEWLIYILTHCDSIMYFYNNIPIIGPCMGLSSIGTGSDSNLLFYNHYYTTDRISSFLDNPNVTDQLDYIYNREIYFIYNSNKIKLYNKYETESKEIILETEEREYDMSCIIPVSYEEYLEKVMDTKIYTREELEQVNK